MVLVSTATGALMVPARPRVLRTMATPRRHRDPTPARPSPARSTAAASAPNRGWSTTLLAQPVVSRFTPGYLYQLLGGVGWTSLPLLPLLRQPTLVLAGDDDPIIPLANAYLMARLLPVPVCTSTTTVISA